MCAIDTSYNLKTFSESSSCGVTDGISSDCTGVYSLPSPPSTPNDEQCMKASSEFDGAGRVLTFRNIHKNARLPRRTTSGLWLWVMIYAVWKIK